MMLTIVRVREYSLWYPCTSNSNVYNEWLLPSPFSLDLVSFICSLQRPLMRLLWSSAPPPNGNASVLSSNTHNVSSSSGGRLDYSCWERHQHCFSLCAGRGALWDVLWFEYNHKSGHKPHSPPCPLTGGARPPLPQMFLFNPPVSLISWTLLWIALCRVTDYC
jgi:hypothetical protein